jgi:Acetyltransferase (GNAT) domain
MTSPAEVHRWATLVQKSLARDVYYLPAYVQASTEMEQSDPVAVVGGSHPCTIFAPLLIRRMSVVDERSRTEWKDACSPYGYGGLLGLSTTGKVDQHDVRSFLEDLQNWCSENRLVCCVLRLHPLICQESWFAGASDWPVGKIVFRGPTSAIDLNDWNGSLNQPSRLRRDRRADMRSAGRVLRVTWNKGDDHDVYAHLDLFSQLYNQNLDRLDAEMFYRFSPTYFYRLAALGEHLGIALAWHGEEVVGGNLFLLGWRYAHGHLAGTNQIGRKYGASTLLLVEGSRRARQRGCELLNLGGGMRSGDSLEDYKRSFGGPSYRYAFFVLIADPQRFEHISRIPNAPWPYSMNMLGTDPTGREFAEYTQDCLKKGV